MRKIGIMEPSYIKSQIFKTAIENATMIMRVDRILYGLKEKDKNSTQIDTRNSVENIN